jgi:hypothetical protein
MRSVLAWTCARDTGSKLRNTTLKTVHPAMLLRRVELAPDSCGLPAVFFLKEGLG